MQFIVLGMHRSGTSMLTRLINLAGAYVGPEHLLLAPHEENPKGFWERRDTIMVNEAILQLHGCAWYSAAGWGDATTVGFSPAGYHFFGPVGASSPVATWMVGR